MHRIAYVTSFDSFFRFAALNGHKRLTNIELSLPGLRVTEKNKKSKWTMLYVQNPEAIIYFLFLFICFVASHFLLISFSWRWAFGSKIFALENIICLRQLNPLTLILARASIDQFPQYVIIPLLTAVISILTLFVTSSNIS